MLNQNTLLESRPPHAKILTDCNVFWVCSMDWCISVWQILDPFFHVNIPVYSFDTGDTCGGFGEFLPGCKVGHGIKGVSRELVAVLEYDCRESAQVFERFQWEMTIPKWECKFASSIWEDIWCK